MLQDQVPELKALEVKIVQRIVVGLAMFFIFVRGGIWWLDKQIARLDPHNDASMDYQPERKIR